MADADKNADVEAEKLKEDENNLIKKAEADKAAAEADKAA